MEKMDAANLHAKIFVHKWLAYFNRATKTRKKKHTELSLLMLLCYKRADKTKASKK
jgi:hypothetical protein